MVGKQSESYYSPPNTVDNTLKSKLPKVSTPKHSQVSTVSVTMFSSLDMDEGVAVAKKPRGRPPNQSGKGATEAVCSVNTRLNQTTDLKHEGFVFTTVLNITHTTESEFNATIELGETDPTTVTTMVNRTLKIYQEGYDNKIRTLTYDWDILKSKRVAQEQEQKRKKRERDFLESLQAKQVIEHMSFVVTSHCQTK